MHDSSDLHKKFQAFNAGQKYQIWTFGYYLFLSNDDNRHVHIHIHTDKPLKTSFFILKGFQNKQIHQNLRFKKLMPK